MLPCTHIRATQNARNNTAHTKADKKKDNNGRERDITKVKVKMRHAVRDDLLRYLQSAIKEKNEEKAG